MGSKFQKKTPHFSNGVIILAWGFKFGLQSENNGLRPKTKFDPQNGRGLWSRNHFCNFRKSHISGTADATIFKFCLLSDFIGHEHKTKFDPKVGVAYGYVTTFKISEKPPHFRNGSR